MELLQSHCRSCPLVPKSWLELSIQARAEVIESIRHASLWHLCGCTMHRISLGLQGIALNPCDQVNHAPNRKLGSRPSRAPLSFRIGREEHKPCKIYSHMQSKGLWRRYKANVFHCGSILPPVFAVLSFLDH